MIRKRCSNRAAVYGHKDKHGWICCMVAKYYWQDKTRRDAFAVVSDNNGYEVKHFTICDYEISEKACIQLIQLARIMRAENE